MPQAGRLLTFCSGFSNLHQVQEVRSGRRMVLSPGVVFVIPAGAPHAFITEEDSSLDVVAFHPDSDFGPIANDHPMINRTIVGMRIGVAICNRIIKTSRCMSTPVV